MDYSNRIVSSFLNRWLRLIVMPTEQCNYRCVYCYEDFTIGKMSPHVSDQVIRLIEERSSSISDLELSWFGGEPLLALDVIERIMGEAIRKRDECGLTLHSGIVTNAHLLTQETAKRLLAVHVNHFQITLDGSRPFHDERRRQRHSTGDYARITGNIRELCRSDAEFVVNIRVHVDKHNLSTISVLFDDLSDILSDSRVSVSLERVKNLGKTLPTAIEEITESELSVLLDTLTREGFDQRAKINNLARVAVGACYAALPNNFVIRADGRIQKCSVILENDINTVGKLRDDGKIELNDRYKKWLSGWQMDDEKWLTCPARTLGRGASGSEPSLLPILM